MSCGLDLENGSQNVAELSCLPLAFQCLVLQCSSRTLLKNKNKQTNKQTKKGCSGVMTTLQCLVKHSSMAQWCQLVVLAPADGCTTCIFTPLSDTVLPAADVFLRGYEACVKLEE